MKVVHVAPTAFGAGGIYGGGERYPLELARALAGLVDCELVTFGRRPGTWREASGLRVRVLRPLVHAGHVAHPVHPAVLTHVARADVVHAHHVRSLPSRLVALAGRLRRQAVVVTDHGLGGGDWWGLLPRLYDGFLCVSQESARLLRAPRERTVVVYGGADPRRFQPDDGERRGVLYVGRITPHKGVDVLLRALDADVAVTVAGTAGHDRHAPERDYPRLVAALARDREVRFTGRVADEDLPGLHRRAAVFVLPSVHTTVYGRHVAVSELLGLSVLEAMASATPVVASRVGGVPEVVVDGETGFLVTPGDARELGERVRQLLADPGLARRLGENGRQVVLERFTWDATARRCVAAYGSLTGAR